MALVKCKECGKEISKKAEACPNCGAKRKRTSLFTWIVGGFFALMMIGYVATVSQQGSSPPDSPREKTAAEKQFDVNLQRAARGAIALRENMRNPKTFELSQVLAMDSNAICFEYRAENGFGGMSLEQAVLSPDDKKFLSTNMNGFGKAWGGLCAGQTGRDLLNAVQIYL